MASDLDVEFFMWGDDGPIKGVVIHAMSDEGVLRMETGEDGYARGTMPNVEDDR
jgi:hypothetical protein